MADDSITEKLDLDVKSFLTNIGSAQVALGTFVGNIVSQVLPALGNMISSLVSSAIEAGKFAEDLENLSLATGISEEHLIGLESAFALSGGSMDSLGQSTRILARNMQEADQGNIEMQKKLALLGITSRDINTAFRQMADTMVKYANDGAKVALVSEVMGRGVANTLPALKDGAKAFDEAAARAADFGTNVPLGKLKEMDDAFDKLGLAVKGFSRTLSAELAPAIKLVADDLTTMVANFTSAFLKGNFLESWKLNMQATIEEIGAFFKAAFTGALFSGGGREALSRQIDEIQARYKALLEDMRKTKVEKPEDDKRPTIGAPKDNKDAIKASEDWLKVKENEANQELALEKAKVDNMRASTQAWLATRQLTAGEALAANIQENELEYSAVVKSNTAKLAALQTFHDKRVALGFGTTAQLENFELEHSIKVEKIKSDITIADQRHETQRLTDRLKTTQSLEAIEEAHGKAIRDAAVSTYNIQKTQLNRALDDGIATSQAELEVGRLTYKSYEDLSYARQELALVQSAKEIGVERDTMRAIIEARITGNEEAEAYLLQSSEATESKKRAIASKATADFVNENNIQANGFAEGWKRGMYEYINNTNSAFNLANQMANNVAQGMFHAFDDLFFNAMNGKINSFKQAFEGMKQFIFHVISQVMAQLATLLAFKLIVMAGTLGTAAPAVLPMGIKAGGYVTDYFPKYAMGGPAFLDDDKFPALLRRGEFVMSPKGVDTLTRANQGDAGGLASGPKSIVVNVIGSGRTDKPQVNQRATMEATILDIIFRNANENGSMRGAF